MTDRQPRWPRGTPVAPSGRGPGGGRFRDAGPDWAAAVAGLIPRRDLRPGFGVRGHGLGRSIHAGVDRQELQERFDSGEQPVDETELAGGAIASTKRLDFADGSSVVWKLQPTSIEADAEFFAALVGEAVGAPVPAVIRTNDPRAIWMGHVTGQSGSQITGFDVDSGMVGEAQELEERWATGEPGWRIGLLDFLIANEDRHPGNWMLTDPDDPASVVGIDHNRTWTWLWPPDSWAAQGFQLAPNAGAKFLQQAMNEHAAGVVPQWLTESEGVQTMLWGWDQAAGRADWDTTHLSLAEADAIDARLRSLEADFDARGLSTWFEYTMARWDLYYRAVQRDALGLAPLPRVAVADIVANPGRWIDRFEIYRPGKVGPGAWSPIRKVDTRTDAAGQVWVHIQTPAGEVVVRSDRVLPGVIRERLP